MAVSIHHMLLFIQSANLLFVHQLSVSIHHMLLFINVCECMAGITIKFQYITCYSLSECVRFGHPPNMVSIHHMLLFIDELARIYSKYLSFQYITCYSLSGRIRSYELPRGVSIHHMLLFIGKPDAGTVPGNHVSIHHMLLFILTRNSEKQSLQGFNTSHVTLYRKNV